MIDWKDLVNIEQLADLEQQSFSKAVGIFKHSSRCFTSFSVKKTLEDEWDLPPSEIEMFFLDLITYRSVSNEIAERFDVIHESPQLIVFRDGKVIYHDSHHKISPEIIGEELRLVSE